MEINEAPDKIYLIRNISTSTSLNTTNDCHEKYLQEWYNGREKDADVEYIRTDVFIDKLKCWLNEKGREYYGEFDEGCFLIEFMTSEEAIEDFKNYIKEEK